MLVTKNRVAARLVSLWVATLFLTACGPPGPRALLKGKDLLEDGKTSAAIEKLKQATTLMQTNAAAWNYLGVAYHRAGEWTNAVDAYSRALRFDRELVEVRFNLGALWLELNRWEDAKGELFSYTSRRPNEAEGWLKLGTAQLRSRELTPAEKSFREALRIETNSVEALNGMGLIQAQRNHGREAVGSFTAALEFQPSYRPALLNLATVLHQQLNEREAALKRYRQYLALQPRPADWEAVNAITKTLEPAPPRAAPITISAIATNRATLTNGQSQATSVVAIRPAQPRPVVQTNAQKPNANVVNPAAPVLRPVTTNVSSSASVPRAVENNPPPPPVESVKLSPEPAIKTTVQDAPVSRSTNAGSVSAPPVSRELASVAPIREVPSEQNMSGKSRYTYLTPKVPAAGNRQAAQQALVQGQAEQRARRTAEALQFYRRAVQLDGSYFEAYYLLGLTAYELRSFNSAANAWEVALAIRPESADARYNFALTLKAAGYSLDAANELEKLLSMHADEARGHLTLGKLYAEQLRDISRARRHYQRVLQLDPRNPQAQAIRYWLVANPG